MKPAATKRPDAATRRAQLLDAADAVFITHGVNAPLELVVERAGVGRATLYRQFPDREAILLALLERSTELLQAQALAVQERPDAFFALLGYLSERIVRSPALSDYWRSSSLVDPRFAQVRKRVWSTLEPALAQAQRAGLVRAEVQADDISLLIGMLGAALRGTSDAERRRLARQALEVIRRGLRPDAATDAASRG
ncbi:TetR/AcrR family transcriptional regulator [Comamonas antarctica]|uniref:TetR/AcrR family transcriptional regulator n=1 Tax=Comamonas antarctica TaxID=2743470 RepID=A0A6N1X2K3_9BURK|nr:TetR/AcrR family transcriptional regulator [Comamonas antarctica]QKV53659.1 TetR/AcrR family transcriptional regulator [Comamonas antarctica]